jgi:UDP-3-O-[3-hydroxymyristoyl] glucosamine N-acyltransferase
MIPVAHILEFIRTITEDIQLSTSNPNGYAIERPKNILEATETDITFLGKKYSTQFKAYLQTTKSRLIIVDDIYKEELKISEYPEKTFVFTTDAKGLLSKISNHFFTEQTKIGIHSTALISSSATIGKNCFIGPYVVIEDDVKIGDDCVLESFIKLNKGVILGNHVKIKSHVEIGGTGFGYIKNSENEYERFAHFGTVIIEDRVEIGCNSSIDRGSLSNTLIKKAVKIDNNVQISHNVEIGENTMIMANSTITGSVIIGENVWISPAVTVRNALKIGNNVMIGIGSLVTKDIEDNTTVFGVPAKPRI